MEPVLVVILAVCLIGAGVLTAYLLRSDRGTDAELGEPPSPTGLPKLPASEVATVPVSESTWTRSSSANQPSFWSRLRSFDRTSSND